MLLIFDTHSLNGALFLKVSTLLARLHSSSIMLDYARLRSSSITHHYNQHKSDLNI